MIVLCAECAVLAGVFYTDRAMDYRGRFLPGTFINEIDAEGMTVKEVEDRLGEFGMDVLFREGRKVRIEGEEIGYHYVSDGSVQRIADGQNPFMWLPARYSPRTFSVEVPKDYDEALLNSLLDGVKELDPENMQEPEDAYVDYRDDAFTVVPEVNGTVLDADAARKEIAAALHAEKKELDLDGIDGLYENPEIRSDDELLNDQADELNELAGADISYIYPDGSIVRLDGPVLMEWLWQDDEGHYGRDDSEWTKKISEYVYGMADQIDTVYKEHPFVTHDGREITVPGKGYYGYRINKNEEIAQLTEELYDNETVEREPVYRRKEAAAPDDNYGFGGTYCEVDLTAQHLWIYQDGELAFETDVVSGTNTRSKRTPDGAYFAYDKKRNTTLRGDKQDDGSWGYETDVAYWIRITDDGIGLHDADWRSRFGGNIWKWNGSHGCIDLPVWAAPTVYDLLEEYTPVVVYY